MRRRLGVESEQAMELFHQTVSMKSVGDLNDFVRSHMLEPFDVKSWIDRLVAHFEDLTKSYDAVVKARSQFEKLEPIIDDCDAYDALGKEIEGLESERAALPYFMAERKTALLETRIGEVEGEITTRRAERGRLSRRRRELDEKRQDLVVEPRVMAATASPRSSGRSARQSTYATTGERGGTSTTVVSGRPGSARLSRPTSSGPGARRSMRRRLVPRPRRPTSRTAPPRSLSTRRTPKRRARNCRLSCAACGRGGATFPPGTSSCVPGSAGSSTCPSRRCRSPGR